MGDKDGYNKDGRGSGKDTFMTFICNRNTGEFCGRTAGSWAKIIIFYIIFYACLAAFWAIMLLIFYQTIDYREPKWQLDDSRIGSNPGLGYRPRAPKNKVESTLIWFTSGKNATYSYILDDFREFRTENEKRRNETSAEDKLDGQQCQKHEPKLNENGKYCQVDPDKFNYNQCLEAEEFGYKEGKPCVLIKLNRIYAWYPTNYDGQKPLPKDMPDPSVHQNGFIAITCEGENPVDKENMGNVTYFPRNGIDFAYFPFLNKPGYISPFVWVKFTNLSRGILVNVECKAWAKNIKHDRAEREGSVHFEILMD